MQHFKLLCMPPLLPTLCITICTTVRKNFAISLVVQLLMYSEKMLSHLAELKLFMYLACITITQSTIITNPIGFNIGLTNVDARLKQRCINIVPTLCNVVSTLCNAVLTLCNVENPTLDFVSFSTSDQRYFNVDPQR